MIGREKGGNMSDPLTHLQWQDAARERYGSDAMSWKFRCPSCGHVASVQDWKDSGAPEGAVAFSCIGRYVNAPGVADKAFKKAGGPCNYTGGGLFKLNPVSVKAEDGSLHSMFDFADDPISAKAA